MTNWKYFVCYNFSLRLHRIPWVFHVQRNPWLFQVCGHPECVFKLMPKRSEWWSSSDGRWQGVPGPCSWHQTRSMSGVRVGCRENCCLRHQLFVSSFTKPVFKSVCRLPSRLAQNTQRDADHHKKCANVRFCNKRTSYSTVTKQLDHKHGF